jgi:hypothetical protein
MDFGAAVTNIDTTGIHSLEDLLTNLTNKNIQVNCRNTGTPPARPMMNRLMLVMMMLAAMVLATRDHA